MPRRWTAAIARAMRVKNSTASFTRSRAGSAPAVFSQSASDPLLASCMI